MKLTRKQKRKQQKKHKRQLKQIAAMMEKNQTEPTYLESKHTYLSLEELKAELLSTFPEWAGQGVMPDGKNRLRVFLDEDIDCIDIEYDSDCKRWFLKKD